VVCKLLRLADRFPPPGYRNHPQRRLGLQLKGFGGFLSLNEVETSIAVPTCRSNVAYLIRVRPTEEI
jgi:hypothetical protein